MRLLDLFNILNRDTLVAVNVKNLRVRPYVFYIDNFLDALLLGDKDDFINAYNYLIISNIEVCTVKLSDGGESFSGLNIDCVFKKEG